MDRVETHVGDVFGRGLDVDLAVDRIAALEADHLVASDSKGGSILASQVAWTFSSRSLGR